jgi:hypothetical protein
MNANDGLIPSEDQKARRRARNRAIAITLGVLVLLFYVVTVVKLGPGILKRPM